MNVYVRELARALGEQGHLVDVYTRSHDQNHPQTMWLGNNARLIHLPAGETGELNKLALYIYIPDFACNVENFRKHSEVTYDLIFSHYWLSGLAGKILQGWWRVPQLIMFHTLGAVKNSLGIGEDEPELRIETEAELMRDCQLIIAATPREKDQLSRLYHASPEKIGIVPCGVNLRLFQPVDRNKARQYLNLTTDRLLLFVGRIEPLKGIDSLLRSLAHLKDKSNLKLIVIGGDEYSRGEVEKLKDLSKELGLEDSVTFPGVVRQEELPYYYSAANACVIPSHYESFGLVALESLACGTPVISTRVGMMEDIIQDGKNGFIVEDNSPQHLAAQISLLLSSPEAFPPDSIRESVTGFDWGRIARKIAAECQALLSSHVAVSGRGR